jgi:F420-0:gamma-glutamyl ligase
MEVRAIKTNILLAGQDLAAFIDRYCRRLKEGSILAVTSKIVALSEGRVAVKKDSETKQALIKAESDFVLRTRRTYLTIKDDMVMANAGLDESNADGRIILLPRDSFRTAASLRRHLMAKHRLNRLGLIITDSRSLPLRAGITGMAIGYAGFRSAV